MQAATGDSPYRSTLSGFRTIWRTEGIAGLYKGVVPTTQRAAVLSATMLSSYDHTKHYILQKGWIAQDNVYAHLGAAMTTGIWMSLVSSPIDVVKTRIMNSRPGTAQSYNSMLDCLYKTARTEGILGLYKGVVPTYMRLGPHTVMAFVIYEQLRQWCNLPPV
eukprot:TRINITY_DN2370_c0_g2_i1.p1 TRINITY_DN2370_c0_g2~~TRINITY_DN2370_c0_g2_i1.p1  ORF type:complete len:162 (+),score=16.56 TRINITY_DN2370_c0_g2_i1:569-1054(+)